MPLNAETIYCGPPCGKVCMPFEHTGSLTFSWTTGEESSVWSATFDGEVCIPFFFPDSETTVLIEGTGYEGPASVVISPNGTCGQDVWTNIFIIGENEMTVTL